MTRPPQPDPTTRVLVIAEPVAERDVPLLCERLRVLLAGSDAEVVVCDVGALAANAITVEALARLQLTARRVGRRIRLRRASLELEQLLSFVGLADVIPVGSELPALPGPGFGPHGQTEQREQPRRVEERVDRDDPAL